MPIIYYENQRWQSYIVILLNIFKAGLVTKRGLSTFDLSVSQINRIYRDLIRNGHVTVITLREPGLADSEAITISAEGVNFLRRTLVTFWTEYLPTKPLTHLRLFDGTEDRSNGKCMRLARYGDTQLFSANMEAFLPEWEPDLEQYLRRDGETTQENGWPKLLDLQLQVAHAILEAGEWPRPGERNFVFVPAAMYRSALLRQMEVQCDSIDFSFSQTTGVLLGKHMVALMYRAGRKTLPWSESNELRDRTNLRAFLADDQYMRFSNNPLCGIILYNSTKNFCDLVENRFQKFKNGDRVGKYFAGVYAIPCSPDGEKLLALMMNYSMDKISALVAYLAGQQYGLAAPEHVGGCLKDGNRILWDMTCLDLARIKSCAEGLQQHPEEDSGVLCWEWQEELFAALHLGAAIYPLHYGLFDP